MFPEAAGAGGILRAHEMADVFAEWYPLLIKSRFFQIGLACFIGAGMVLSARFPSHAHAQPPVHRRITTLDYSPAPERGMPLVRVRLNNGHRNTAPATFVVDTGFTPCLMTDRLAQTLQIDGEPARRDDGSAACFADGKPLQQVTAGLQIGGLQTDARSFLLLKAYRLDLLDCPLDGVLGWDFLSDYAVMFDFQAHHITLWQGGNLTDEERRSVSMQDAFAFPRANKTPGSFDITVRLRSPRGLRDVTLAVDTGGARTLIAPQDARALDLEPTRIALPQRSIFGSLKVNEAALQTLEIGGLRLSDFPVRYLTQEHPNMPPHLGLDVLSHYRLLIDYPAKTLYLK